MRKLRWTIIQISPWALHIGFGRTGGSYLAPAPIAELPSCVSRTTPDMIRIDFQRVAHPPERERSIVLAMKKPGLGFRKLLLLRQAASVEIDLIASHSIDQNCVHKTRERLERSAALPLLKELLGQNGV